MNATFLPTLKKGYASEMGKAMIPFVFEQLEYCSHNTRHQA